uniref:ATP-dependent RNA helicase n=1 Tax=Strongyloides venezuelensis TaxID=75913 RepID=A0A0K0FUC7_STRVS
MSIFSDYKKFPRVNLQEPDELSFSSLSLGKSLRVKRCESNPRNVFGRNYRFSANNNERPKGRFFNENRELHIPKRNECTEISENRKSYIQENFSDSCDIPANKIISSYKFINESELANSWETSGLVPILCKNIQIAAYKRPREIQKRVIPLMLKGLNLQVSTRTGSGKTVSYIIPIIHQVSEIKSKSGHGETPQSPFAIIIVPTMELALQVSDRIVKLTTGLNVSCSRVVGGYSFNYNKAEICQGCDIVVGTLGRLGKMMTQSHIRLTSLRYFVIDECDHFVIDDRSQELSNIMEFMRSSYPNLDIQISVFMSVSSPDISSFLEKYTGRDFAKIVEPRVIQYSQVNFVYNPNIIHKMYFVKERKEKPEKLLELIRIIRASDIKKANTSCTRIIIFTDTILWCKQITSYICMMMSDIHCNEFNGNLSSLKREQYLEEFQKTSSEIQILVSTDLLSRGIDIYSLNHVINYDLPEHFESFHHRIGRVGRINKGYAYTLIDESDSYDCTQVPNIINLLDNVGQLDEPIQRKLDYMYKSINP